MNILVFAPHNDDETLGAGGTIARYAAKGHKIYVCEVTSGTDTEMVNRIKEEAYKAHKILGVSDAIFLDFPVVGLKDMDTAVLNAGIDRVVRQIKPEIAFIPHQGDMHIDHQEVAKAAMVALRPMENPQLRAIYAYETLSETEWNIPSCNNLFVPTHWIEIEAYLSKKLEAMKCYQTQLKEFPHPRSLEAMESLARLRGATVGRRAAESFMVIREIV